MQHEYCYAWLVSRCGGSIRTVTLDLGYLLLFFISSLYSLPTVFFIITFIFYWTFNTPFIILELTGWPKALLKYRIQLEQKPPVVCDMMQYIVLLKYARLLHIRYWHVRTASKNYVLS